MSIKLTDDSQYSGRYLPVLTSRQSQGIGVSARHPEKEKDLPSASARHRYDVAAAAEGYRQALETGSETRPGFATFDYRGRQGYHRDFQQFSGTSEADPALVAATYRENSEAPLKPFYLGEALDLVG